MCICRRVTMYTDQVQTICCLLLVSLKKRQVEFQTLFGNFFQPLQIPDMSETIAWTCEATYVQCNILSRAGPEPGAVGSRLRTQVSCPTLTFETICSSGPGPGAAPVSKVRDHTQKQQERWGW